MTLPLGIFSPPGEAPRAGARRGDRVLDLAAVGPAELSSPSLNPLMAAGPERWAEVAALDDAPDLSLADVQLHLPFEVADYVDFYSSLEHATNLGRLFRPDAEPLLPNWRHLPVGYHGRAGTVVPSGTPIRRPSGQTKPPDADAPRFGPSRRLDIELELGFVTGSGPPLGHPIPASAAADHIFGFVLVDDWSAREIQRWEYQPLGPFLGKSFATSISPWIVPLEAIEPLRVEGPQQEPGPLDYLRVDQPRALDIALEIGLIPAGGDTETIISRTNARGLYWSAAQLLAHATVNGATVRAGDLFASGTISGPDPGSYGSLLELSWGGRDPLRLGGGAERTFLEDGDTVVMRGVGDRDGVRISFGEVRGTVLPASEDDA